MSPVLRRLGVTLRRAPEVRDVTCHDPRHTTALELLGRIDAALREHDHRLTTDLADDVARALDVEQGRARLATTALRDHDQLTEQLDTARAETRGAYDAIGRIAAAAGRPGAPERWNVEDLVEWATAARKAATSRLVGRLADAARVTAARRETLGELAPDGVVDARIVDALDRWDGAVLPGRWVCDACGAPVGAGPCREHQPDAYAAMFAEAGVELSDDERAELTRTMTAAGDPGPVLALGPGQRGTLAWTATRVYGVNDRSVGITMPRTPAEPLGYGRPRYAAGWVSGPAPSCVHGYRLTDSCPGCDALDEQGGPRPIDDPWCSADLDGAACARPAEHTEPCRPAEPAPIVPVAQCPASGHRSGRCRGVAGHPGAHEWVWQR